jgi:acetyl-CoA carboxylase biotin carboxyl carrier protein
VGSENPRAGVLMSTAGKVRRRRPTSHRPLVGNASDRRSNVQTGGYGGAGSRGAQEDAVADVEAHITGTVWKIECEVGDEIEEGDTVVILESMKMEMPVEAEDAGTVREILCEEGQAVNEGDTLVVLE